MHGLLDQQQGQATRQRLKSRTHRPQGAQTFAWHCKNS